MTLAGKLDNGYIEFTNEGGKSEVKSYLMNYGLYSKFLSLSALLSNGIVHSYRCYMLPLATLLPAGCSKRALQ